MLKVSEGQSREQSITFRLEGRIVGPWVEELRNICEPLLQGDRTITLNLAEVVFLDEEGIGLLTRLRSHGVELLNGTPFVEEQLKSSPINATALVPDTQRGATGIVPSRRE